MKRLLSTLLFAIIFCLGSQAQQVIIVNGANVTKTGEKKDSTAKKQIRLYGSVYDSFTKVDNRFVDFSAYTHTAASQELPAFYTVSALGTFCMYTGSSPWRSTGSAESASRTASSVSPSL